MKQLRRAGITVVVAVFSAGLLTGTAGAASAAEEGASAKKLSGSYSTQGRRDTGWN